MRVGFGYDVHQLKEGRRFVLGGVTIESNVGLLGHSDADALCHAIGDALLGSLALGDLGTHFPDTDERFAGVSSLILLKQIARLLEGENYQVTNIDSTIVLEQPRMAPYIPEMRNNIASVLGVSESLVSIKATSSEGMGFVGRTEGIAVYACAAVQPQG